MPRNRRYDWRKNMYEDMEIYKRRKNTTQREIHTSNNSDGHV